MVVLGLRFCARAFSSCGERGPLFIAVRGPLTIVASLVAEHRLQTRRLSCVWLTGLVAPRHVGSSQTRARTRVLCIGRQTLNHCATREAPTYILFQILFHSIECLLSLSSMHIRFLFKCPCLVWSLNRIPLSAWPPFLWWSKWLHGVIFSL